MRGIIVANAIESRRKGVGQDGMGDCKRRCPRVERATQNGGRWSQLRKGDYTPSPTWLPYLALPAKLLLDRGSPMLGPIRQGGHTSSAPHPLTRNFQVSAGRTAGDRRVVIEKERNELGGDGSHKA